MPRRQWRLRVQDILEAIALIQQHVRGMDLESFCRDIQVQDAVEHRLAVIGESANNIPADIVQRHPEVPWREMRGMRNVVVHVYFGVKLDVLWGTIQNDLPPLVPLLRALLEQERGAP